MIRSAASNSASTRSAPKIRRRSSRASSWGIGGKSIIPASAIPKEFGICRSRVVTINAQQLPPGRKSFNAALSALSKINNIRRCANTSCIIVEADRSSSSSTSFPHRRAKSRATSCTAFPSTGSPITPSGNWSRCNVAKWTAKADFPMPPPPDSPTMPQVLSEWFPRSWDSRTASSSSLPVKLTTSIFGSMKRADGFCFTPIASPANGFGEKRSEPRAFLRLSAIV